MKKNFLKILIVAIALFFCTTANAMTGLEFMQSPILEQSEILKQHILHYVSQGYKKVPDWIDLKIEIETQIRRWGMGNKNIEDISLEAAKQKGMTTW
jgi:hypothetical protein